MSHDLRAVRANLLGISWVGVFPKLYGAAHLERVIGWLEQAAGANIAPP